MYMYDFCMIQRTLSAVEIFTFEICHSISLRKKGRVVPDKVHNYFSIALEAFGYVPFSSCNKVFLKFKSILCSRLFKMINFVVNEKGLQCTCIWGFELSHN